MPLPAFVGQTQIHLQHASTHAREVVKNTSTYAFQALQLSKDWIITQFATIRTFWQTAIWTPLLKPLHERYIQPLGRSDAVYLSASTIVATAIVVFTPLIFGKALFAIAAVSGLTVFLGACTLAQHRAQCHHSDNAWAHIEHMREALNSTTARRNYFTIMHQELAELQKSVYSHHAEEIKALVKQLESFKKVASAPYFEDRKTLVNTFINHLKTLAAGIQDDIYLLDALEQDIAHVGTEKQNFGVIENKRLALFALQTAAAREELGTLTTRIDELRASTEGMSFAESKRVFDEQLKQFQWKLTGKKGANLASPDLTMLVEFSSHTK